MSEIKTTGRKFFWPFNEKVAIEGLDVEKISGCTLYDINGMKIQAPMECNGNKLLISTRGLKKGIYCVKFQGFEDFCRIFVLSR